MDAWRRLDHHVKVRLPITLGVMLAAIVSIGLVTAPSRRTPFFSPPQPIAFAHDRHAGLMKIDCRYCHVGVETSRIASVPSSQICMNCHTAAMIDRPGVVALRTAYAAGTPIRWKRVHRLPDFVYFAHDVHFAAGATCQQCHGQVQHEATVRQVLPLSMGDCITCHRNAASRIAGAAPGLRGPDDCSSCHR